MSNAEAVAEFPLFAALAHSVLEKLLAGSSIQRVSAGTVLFSEGHAADVVHFVLSGIVEISRIEGKRECGVLMFTRGDVVMPAAALFEEPYLTSARTLSGATLLRINPTALRKEAMRDPELCMRLCSVISGQWRMAVRHILDLKCRSAPQRLAAFLLRMVDQSGPGDAVLPFSKQHLAVRVGMSPETLSRTLQQLSDNGLHVRGKRIIVKDRAMAESFCGPDPYPERGEAPLGVYAL
jgi:CRP/FNR family transcriptional activator FtrB